MIGIIHFTNCYLADNSQLVKKDLYIDTKQGIIIDGSSIEKENNECKEGNQSEAKVEVIDLDGNLISPGFIDIQINGCFGLDYSTTFEDFQSKANFVLHYTESMEKLLNHGVTSVCPTVTSSFPNVYNDVMMIIGLKTRSSTKTDSLGVHLEGPFISPLKKGCHPPETLTTMENGYQSLIDIYGEEFEKYTAILTAAPEVDNCLEVIPEITKDNKIAFSIGHTMSDFETGLQSIKNGASMITHLYNAMPSLNARNPGVIGLTNTTQDILPSEKIPYYGLVSDGIHVHPTNIKSSYFANPGKTILVTDAMYLIGLEDGIYKRGNQEIEKNGNLLHLKDTKTIAGSATHLIDCVNNLIKWTGISIEKALATVTNNPAMSLNISKRKGFLKTGCDADLVILTPQGEIKQVYKLGNRIV